ncbi:hypothetical protein Q8A67_020279 [Cirrhinus molitorella]|uniref:Uncharacterized protein n=1 Tax=Cirrhinus molitorella TaxID=172907 RepID=A0AA88TCQ1_9TELE|nr:hypothetical protein Q8A67_020279 [Cirrhinus molitorella]
MSAQLVSIRRANLQRFDPSYTCAQEPDPSSPRGHPRAVPQKHVWTRAFPRALFHQGQNGPAVLFSLLLLRPLLQTFILHRHKRPFAPEAPDLPPSGPIAGFQGQDQAEGHQSQICPLHWSLSIMVSR